MKCCSSWLSASLKVPPCLGSCFGGPFKDFYAHPRFRVLRLLQGSRFRGAGCRFPSCVGQALAQDLQPQSYSEGPNAETVAMLASGPPSISELVLLWPLGRVPTICPVLVYSVGRQPPISSNVFASVAIQCSGAHRSFDFGQDDRSFCVVRPQPLCSYPTPLWSNTSSCCTQPVSSLCKHGGAKSE